MTSRRIFAPRIDFTELRRELELPTGFSAAAAEEAEAAAKLSFDDRPDRTDLPFVTIDPPTSKDLDQALLLRRGDGGGGYRVWYAIADVAAFVTPGGALEAETRERGQTVYLPDGKVPLHPRVLSEGAASLLPGADRPAVLWTIDLDAEGATTAVTVERARVRSRAQLHYEQVQRDVDAGTAHESVALLPEVGKLLVERGLRRGAVDLPLPEQEVEPDGDGWRLTLRAPVPVEEYNAQISLLTGMAAARIMLDGKVGLLRTMPAPPDDVVDRLRLAAGALGVPWPDGASPGRVIAALDPARPRAAAFLDQAAEMLRGAGYTAFDGAEPEQPLHAAVAAPYAHVTAPLRRLADRYVTEVCLALFSGAEVPLWAREALPKLPEVMRRTDRVAGAAERGAVDLTEAVLLAGRVGEQFEAAVLDVEPKGDRGAIALDEPPVRARCVGEALPLGERIRVRLADADPARRRVQFERVQLEA
ncbi:RNB domain-containing ribonuclease [Dactylosporangium roseum]|uniref:RNB domain-containing ribonuclease n=1 Tax=Dactylosporangium roseum TaxID=47989 RepID=A0ABY5Z3N0_9ACTN|nr:RNB domain-containing ribonuclease [Dactylosporangium roseum]UWZ35358.1 RNB domain-containing ribonuclease [Dactylosporangium roseum]